MNQEGSTPVAKKPEIAGYIKHDYETAQKRLQEHFSHVYSGLSTHQLVARLVNMEVFLIQTAHDLLSMMELMSEKGLIKPDEMMKLSSEKQHKMYLGLKKISGIL